MMRFERGSCFILSLFYFTSLLSFQHTMFIVFCRSAASFRRASESKRFVASSETGNDNKDNEEVGPSKAKLEGNTQRDQGQIPSSWFPFGHLFYQPWSKQRQEPENRSDTRYIH